MSSPSPSLLPDDEEGIIVIPALLSDVVSPSAPEITPPPFLAGPSEPEAFSPIYDLPDEASPPPEEIAPAVEETPLVLVVHPVATTSRLIRETLESFTSARVETTPDPVRGLELALLHPYRVYFFAMKMPELSGPTLYEMISTAHRIGRGTAPLAPGLVLVREKEDPKLPDDLANDARIKGVVTKPIRIERLLESIKGALELRDPTQR